jgi:hypothetical protein
MLKLKTLWQRTVYAYRLASLICNAVVYEAHCTAFREAKD